MKKFFVLSAGANMFYSLNSFSDVVWEDDVTKAMRFSTAVEAIAAQKAVQTPNGKGASTNIVAVSLQIETTTFNTEDVLNGIRQKLTPLELDVLGLKPLPEVAVDEDEYLHAYGFKLNVSAFKAYVDSVTAGYTRSGGLGTVISESAKPSLLQDTFNEVYIDSAANGKVYIKRLGSDKYVEMMRGGDIQDYKDKLEYLVDKYIVSESIFENDEAQ